MMQTSIWKNNAGQMKILAVAKMFKRESFQCQRKMK
jgi:hypothetical protein